ncbi:MAG: hypothetical protein KGL39_00950 [Patescibacteria group bacterium]|nr:hypothetical protein [Patescibacteria group bacterium]
MTIRKTLAMANQWLILDVPYLAHRALYSLGLLYFNTEPTAVTFGLLRDLQYFEGVHGINKFIFCFDRGRGLREQAEPSYKQNRRDQNKKLSEEEAEIRGMLRVQINRLRFQYLPQLGYRNILSEPGYEADDLIASVVGTVKKLGDSTVIIAADKDLYQLLSGDQIRMWDPRKKTFYTERSLAKEFYGLSPNQWPFVKAMAGCSGDGVEGIQGVGEMTAAKFLRGLLKEGTKVHQRILDSEEIWQRNLPLVKLPYLGTPTYTLQEDEVTPLKWKSLAEQLGMKSLLNEATPSFRPISS